MPPLHRENRAAPLQSDDESLRGGSVRVGVRVRDSSPVIFEPLKGRYPQSIMYIMTPSDQISQASE